MFIRKSELESFLQEFRQNKRWYNHTTWDDQVIILLQKFVTESLADVKNNAEIAYADFLKFSKDNGFADLLNEDYWQSKAPSRYIFLTWQNNSLNKLPWEAWLRIMHFLHKQDMNRLTSTCHFFKAYTDTKLINTLPFAPPDYSQSPKRVIALPAVDVITSQINGHYIYAMSLARPKVIGPIDNILHIIDIRTANIVASHATGMHFEGNRDLYLMANGNLLYISSNGGIRILNPETGQCVKNVNEFFGLALFYRYREYVKVWPEKNSLIFYPPKNGESMPFMFFPGDDFHPNELYVKNVDTGEGHYLPLTTNFQPERKFSIVEDVCFYVDEAGQTTKLELPNERADAILFNVNPLPNGDLIYGYCKRSVFDYPYDYQFFIARFPELTTEPHAVKTAQGEKSNPAEKSVEVVYDDYHEEEEVVQCRMM